MFGFKKEKAASKEFLNATDFQAENIPIHTMSRDLESFSPTEVQSENDAQENEQIPEVKIESPLKTPGSSPFLPNVEAPKPPDAPTPGPKIESFAKTISTPLPEKEVASVPEQKTIVDVPEEPSSKDNAKKKFIIILIIILLLVLLFAGGYYFWSTRNAYQAQPENITPPEAKNENEPVADKTPATPANEFPKFSNTERNYFMLDIGSASGTSFKPMVQNYFNEISDSKISFPVEFTIIDTGNTPVSFSTFAEKIGIKFSPELMSALNDDFNFYIYSDQGNPGTGLALSVKEELDPEEKILREEVDLPMELESIFPVSDYSLGKAGSFSTGEHDSAKWGKVGVRFWNITSPQNLSIDYTFINTGKYMLFLGTSKNTLRSIIDNAGMGLNSQ